MRHNNKTISNTLGLLLGLIGGAIVFTVIFMVGGIRGLQLDIGFIKGSQAVVPVALLAATLSYFIGKYIGLTLRVQRKKTKPGPAD